LKVAGGESFFNAGVFGMLAQVGVWVRLKSTTEHTDPSTELRVVLSLSKDGRTEPKRLFFSVILVIWVVLPPQVETDPLPKSAPISARRCRTLTARRLIKENCICHI
jgi:hypothetical protein